MPANASFRFYQKGKNRWHATPCHAAPTPLLQGRPARRETSTMPQWAGSCWYYLRYIDPLNDSRWVVWWLAGELAARRHACKHACVRTCLVQLACASPGVQPHTSARLPFPCCQARERGGREVLDACGPVRWRR